MARTHRKAGGSMTDARTRIEVIGTIALLILLAGLLGAA
jgi:hypothetical protein